MDAVSEMKRIVGNYREEAQRCRDLVADHREGVAKWEARAQESDALADDYERVIALAEQA